MSPRIQKSTPSKTKKSKDVVSEKKDDPEVKVLNGDTTAKWNSSRDAVLVNALLEHAANGERTDTRFTRTAWDETLTEFNKRFMVCYTYQQIKNRYQSVSVHIYIYSTEKIIYMMADTWVLTASSCVASYELIVKREWQ